MKTLLAGALLMMGATAMAQEAEYDFEKHWFLNIQGGGQYTLGEAKFGDLLSPNVQLGLGYQFSPVVGVRLQANGWQSMGGWANFRDTQFGTPRSLTYKYKYVAPGLDVMFNLSNAFCGFNPMRTFNVTAFVGAGANIGFSNDEANDLDAQIGKIDGYRLEYVWDGTQILPFGRAGLQLGFRLSDAISLLVEGNANITSDKYNSKKAGNPDMYFNALAGVRINLGKTYTKREKPIIYTPDPDNNNNTDTETIPVIDKGDTPPVDPPVVKADPITRNIFFDINRSVVKASEQSKVKEIADYLKKYPKAKVQLCGYADAQTGNDRINDRLGRERVEAVKDALVNQYNISASRISTDSKGARVQPFSVNEQNRVTIAIAAE